MYALYSFAAGLVFGIGLIVSEMFSPVKVLAFLDLAGNWDPSLLLVMAGAIAVGVIAFALARNRTASFLGAPMHLPQSREIDRPLVAGSLLFGIGWGLAGFCPGPALVALGTGHVKAFIFVIAMLAGMAIYEFLERKRTHKAADVAAKLRPHPQEHPGHRHRARKGH